MALKRRAGEGLNPWPGYVDALSTLLMVTIFVLLVFVLAQGFLSVALSGRDQALERLNRQVAELSDMLSLERGRRADLDAAVARLSHDLAAAAAARTAMAAEVASLQEQAEQAAGARDALRQERDRLAAALSDAEARAGAARAHAQQVEAQLADATEHGGEAVASATAALTGQIRALAIARDEARAKAADAAARSEADQARLEAAEMQAAVGKAEIEQLTQQLAALRAQLQQVAAALELSQHAATEKDRRIADLGQKLNLALAGKVAELQRYRSEFFGRLREVLAGRPGISIVGDRFVFQSEVLFPAGSAELTPQGREQIHRLAATLKDIAARIPPDLPWMLRVDGHADRQPVHGAFASNWELSTQRAINVVRLLTADGIPARHLAATGFAEYQPLDPADTPSAYARNRRIELRLTDR
jgi:chemotaxis protein MotB